MKHLFTTLATVSLLLLTACTDAGKSQTVTAGTKVTLDGSGAKTDLGGTITRYTWEQLPKDGVAMVHIFDKYSEYASFIAPNVSKVTSIKFKLTTVESYNCKNDQDSSCNHHKSSSKVKITIEPSSDANTTNSSQNNSTNNGTVTGSYTVASAGKITTVGNIGIGGAVVTGNGKTITTTNTGAYALSQIQTSGRVIIHASHPEYFDNSHILIANLSNNFSQNIKLAKPLVRKTFDSGEGTTVLQGKASIEIPADVKYLSSNNKSYSGDVTVKMSYYDTRQSTGRSLLPGNYEGSDGSNHFPLYAHSFMHLSLTDKEGKVLHLASQSSIKLHFPDSKSTDNTPKITTWIYDNDTGYWLKEGTSDRVNEEYIVTANISGTYGLHTIAPYGTLNLCVRDSSDRAIQGANIVVKTGDWAYPLTQTDVNGEVSLDHVLASNPLTITASKVIAGKAYSETYSERVALREGELLNLTECIELGEAAPSPSPSPSPSSDNNNS